jgi:chromate reductase
MTVKLLGISGSLRRDSYNTAILRSLANLIAGKAALEVFTLNDVPPYNGDLDTDDVLPPVAALRDAIGAADGLIVATPEYNHGISGVLKNAFDWASRPYGQATIIGKPVLTLSSSMMLTGGVRAQAQLNETLASITARVVLRPQIVIPTVHDKLIDGKFAHQPTADFLVAAVDDLLADIRSRAVTAIEQA